MIQKWCLHVFFLLCTEWDTDSALKYNTRKILKKYIQSNTDFDPPQRIIKIAKSQA